MNKNKRASAKSGMPRIMRLVMGEPGYPAAVVDVLKAKAPKTLYCLGKVELMEKVGVGFCGSRKSSEKGLETARDCAWLVGQAAFNVVSGNAAGIDCEAHKAALESGGTTILVLPEGINHFRVRKVFEGVWDWQRVLIVSQFEPDAAWKTFRAMERNQIIIALSKAVIVIEAGETGGTLDTGMRTLKMGRPLFVAVYDNMVDQAPGNDRLLQLGGHRLNKSRSMGRANLNDLFEKITSPDNTVRSEGQGQLDLR